MKKAISFILCICVLVSVFTGCSNTGETSNGSSHTVEEVFNTVKDAYGEDFLPSMDIDETQLSDVIQVNMENVENFKAQGPAMSAHVDMLIVIEAKDGKETDVMNDLETYRQNQIDNAINYPMNMPKLEASQVVIYDNFVIFLMLGKYNDDENISEDELLTFYEEQTQIGIGALDKLFES